ncbi:hypothetical protein [Paractinoplanes durhamensis]|uniref:hypothetical protein n=1 Tax=Paractinoplanes durhamensis TaxID=113563 RepID=UPI0031D97A8B
MPDDSPIGRAPVQRPPHGRAKVGRAVGKARLPAEDVTSLIRAESPEPPPVFVDPSGARRRRLRWATYAAGLLPVLVLAAVWVSQLTGPAAPPARPSCSAGACTR